MNHRHLESSDLVNGTDPKTIGKCMIRHRYNNNYTAQKLVAVGENPERFFVN